jgi:hypothetical protein
MDAAQAFPALAAVRWYGSDGTVQSRELLGDPTAAAFAQRVGFPSSLFAETPSPRGERARAAIRAVVGFEPQVCALTAYDAIWVAGLSALVADDPAALRRAVPRTAEHYFGVSGGAPPTTRAPPTASYADVGPAAFTVARPPFSIPGRGIAKRSRP